MIEEDGLKVYIIYPSACTKDNDPSLSFVIRIVGPSNIGVERSAYYYETGNLYMWEAHHEKGSMYIQKEDFPADSLNYRGMVLVEKHFRNVLLQNGITLPEQVEPEPDGEWDIFC